jgi:hypothetical protein
VEIIPVQKKFNAMSISGSLSGATATRVFVPRMSNHHVPWLVTGSYHPNSSLVDERCQFISSHLSVFMSLLFAGSICHVPRLT